MTKARNTTCDGCKATIAKDWPHIGSKWILIKLEGTQTLGDDQTFDACSKKCAADVLHSVANRLDPDK